MTAPAQRGSAYKRRSDAPPLPAFGETTWLLDAVCGTACRTAFEPRPGATGLYSIPNEALDAARRYCGRCPVIEQCAAFARRHRHPGLWGGQWRLSSGDVHEIRTKTDLRKVR